MSSSLGIVEDSVNLWRLPVSPADWTAAGIARAAHSRRGRKTSFVGHLVGRIVFANTVRKINVWRLPLNVNDGLSAGPMERLTDADAADFQSGRDA